MQGASFNIGGSVFMKSTQNQPNENISWHILVGTIVTIVPATLCVILRFISRHVSRAGLWWDDYTIAVALLFNWGMAVLRWAQIPLYEYGIHSHDISSEKFTGFEKSFLAVQLLYFCNAAFTKASFLLLFYRIFGVVKSFRWVLWGTGYLVIAYFIACTITAIAGCSPVSKFWDPSKPGHCIDEVAFFRWNGVGNMLLDFLVLCLPLPMAWRVKTSMRQKWVLTGIFLLGGFVCVVSILRIVSFEHVAMQDPTYTSVDPATWSSVEQSVGIVCACLPTLRPLFRVLYCSSGNTSETSGSSVSDCQQMPPLPSSISHCDEESNIIGLTQSSAQTEHMDYTPLGQSDMNQSGNHLSTFHESHNRHVSQFSQTNGTERPVSAVESLT